MMLRSLLVGMGTCAAGGAVVVAGLSAGFVAWVVCLFALLIGPAVGVPVGYWLALRLGQQPPDEVQAV